MATADGEGTTLDDASIAQVGEAAKGLRTTAKGTAAAVATLGTTLGGAITFTGLTSLDGDRFWWGAAGLALIVVAAAIVIVVVGYVLMPTDVALAEADKDCSVRRLIPGMLLGAADVRAFEHDLTSAETDYEVAMRTTRPPMSPGLLEQFRERAAMYGARAERIRLIAHFYELNKRWRRGQFVLLAGAIVVACGVIMYEHATSDQQIADHLPPAFVAAPDLIVHFTPGKLTEAARCAGARRGVIIPDTTDGQTVVLLRPKVLKSRPPCPGALVRVADLDVTTTLAPVAKAQK
jgi:hypothetical protein